MDSLKVTILPDGRIKVETGRFSPAIHTNADALLATILKLAGGTVEWKRKPGGGEHHHHDHVHDHVHGHSH